ncbi:high-potential iron-sulfur protein [Thiohalorhabdus methylotrophus]|uniref:High-potential iron-sulfur protein n=1 Tax=Thiohalorhabdus methylotrophus TaxID=3242694 RepID=A0ABV4TQM7_9GAMM
MTASKLTRRGFLRNAVLTTAVLPVTAALTSRQAWAQEKVQPSEPQAKSLKYTHDASTVEAPQYSEGQKCSNCQFYQAGPDTEWGPCTIFGGREVAAEGWCTSYVPKA